MVSHHISYPDFSDILFHMDIPFHVTICLIEKWSDFKLFRFQAAFSESLITYREEKAITVLGFLFFFKKSFSRKPPIVKRDSAMPHKIGFFCSIEVDGIMAFWKAKRIIRKDGVYNSID